MVLKSELFLNYILFFASFVEPAGVLWMNRAKYSHTLNKRDVVEITAVHKCKLRAALDGIIFALSASPR